MQWIPFLSIIGFILWVAVVIAIFQIHIYTRQSAENLKEIRRILENWPKE